MPLIRKVRIWWESVPEAAGYGIYASADQSVFDPANFRWENTPGVFFKTVQSKTDLILPDEWVEFPDGIGTYYIGITSRDEMGNQSDPFVSSGQFRFIAPRPPSKAGIELI